MKRILLAISLIAGAIAAYTSCDEQEQTPEIIKVESISIDQEDITLTEGESVILTATVLPENAAEKTVAWSSSDEGVVMVSSSGKVMAISVGKAAVTAKAGDKTDFITITVSAKVVPVTGISLTPSSITMKVGETQTVTAEVTPQDATDKSVTWVSSNPDVATVENGTVTGLKPGSVTITATTVNGGKTAECTVTIKANLAPSVTIGADHISAVSAVLSGEANLASSTSSDMTMGIMWSINSGVLPANSTRIEAKDIKAKTGFDASYEYSVGITGIEPNTTYYYRSYVTQNGQDTYGETKSFTTKDLSTMLRTLEATSISAVSSRLNARLDLTDVQYVQKSVGFYYWLKDESQYKAAESAGNDGSPTAYLAQLKPSSTYSFCVYISLDGKTYVDESLSFTTKDLSSLLETQDATEVKATKAYLNAKLNLTDITYSSISYGFYWGTSENSQETFVEGGNISGNTYKSYLSGLSHKTQYWYKAYAELDGQSYFGEVKSFTTDIIPVESVELDRTEYTFKTIGNSIILKATIIPNNATDRSIIWTSSNDGVAKVDESGTVTAIGNGTAIITATTNDQGKTATCTITVAQQITNINLDRYSLTLNVGQSYTFTVSLYPDNANNKELEWVSTDESVAVVDEYGTVTAISRGSAGIRALAKDGSGKQGYCSVAVNQPVTAIELNKTAITIHSGKTETITATVYPSTANNKELTWASSNTSVAAISSSGVVSGITPGTTTITATAKDGSGVNATCEVEVKQLVTGLSLEKTMIVLNEGEEATLNATITPSNANDQALKWRSSNDSFVTVSEGGKVKAITKGSAVITVDTQDGSNLSASCSIIVHRLVSSISLDKTSLVLYTNQSETINATVLPSSATNTSISWSTSNPDIATISSSGTVTAKNPGLTTITATANDGSGIKATCEVEVKQYITEIELNQTSINLNVGGSYQIGINHISPDDASDKTVSWSSGDESVATVNNEGVITGIGDGIATITATANDGSGVCAYCFVFVGTGHAYSFDTELDIELGEHAYDDLATVNGVDSIRVIKLGTKSAIGAISVTVPAGTRMISYYAVGWFNNQATLVFQRDGEPFASQSIIANEGATNSSPYTITVTGSDYYTIQAEFNSDSVINITTTSTQRAIILGLKAIK